jgi:serine/threonine-protein kinase HipA
MKLKVYLNMYGKKQEIGLLYEKQNRVLFEYSKDFISSGIEISPFKLPLKNGVFEEKNHIFDGLFGVFNDSLPDGWGRLLIDRKLRQKGISFEQITPLMRLSIIGKNPMGALEYEPADEIPAFCFEKINLDSLSGEIKKILNSDEYIFDELRLLNGSSGGARPKIIANISKDKKLISYENNDKPNVSSEWIIKFPTNYDLKNIGEIEYLYSLAAKESGIDMPETYLFKSRKFKGYFGVKRFDRTDSGKVHVHTVCGLLHASHLINSIDYENILKLTLVLTKDEEQLIEMIRRMIFNVKTYNCDDHSKNFAFLLDKNNKWKLAPAYDLTPSEGFNGEHTSTVNGKGKDITDNDLIFVAEQVGVKKAITQEIIFNIEQAIKKYKLNQFFRFV